MDTKKRVLIADDEPQIGKIFSLKLKLAGYDVVSTTSGAEAIELVRTRSFDVVLLDVLMPDVTGLDVIDGIRQFSQIPIIIFTAKPDVVELAKRLGANEFISKPLNPDLLVGKIKAVLGETSGKA